MTNPSSDFWPRRIAIVGVGLLGGSVAGAIRKQIPHVHVAGCVRSQERQRKLVELGILDSASSSLEEVCRDAEVVVVGTPVDKIAELSIQAAKVSPSHCLITDVGSTKRSIVEAIEKNDLASQLFVGAHPIAGSEKTGAEHARDNLFENKVIVLTPTASTSDSAMARAERFWRLTGSRIVTLSPEDHDTHLASVSHVPHLASSAITMLVSDASASLVGSGWLDITRVAAGDPAMWLAICQENRTAVHDQLKRLANSIDEVCQMIASGDDESLLSWLEQAKRIREKFSTEPRLKNL